MLPAAHAARAHDRGAVPVAAGVHRALRAHRRRARRLLADDALVMHPGPMNRGVEIAAEVADLPAVVIIDQVRNGVAVRMAVLFLLLAAEPSAGAAERLRALARARACWCRKGADDARHPGRTGHRRHRRARRRRASSTTAASSRSGPTSTATRVLDAAGASSRPASSTSTCTSASRAGRRPRRSRPAAGPRRSAASPRSSPCRTPTRRSTAPSVVREVLDLGPRRSCDVRAAGAITIGRAGEQLAPMAELAELGVRLFTDDGTGVQDNRLMRRAMEYAVGLPRAVVARPALRGRRALRRRAHARGRVVGRLGIPGQPAEAEELMVARDLALARLTGAPVHFQHLSTAGSVELVRAAPRPTGCRSPPRRPPTTSRSPTPSARATTRCSRSTRRCAPTPTSPRSGRSGRRHHRRHRHRPRAPHPGGQGAALRPGAARDARARDRAGARAHRARPAHRAGPRPALLAAGPHRRPRRPPRRADRRGRRRQPLRDRPRPPPGPSTPTRSASRSRNTPFAGRTLTGPGPPHDPPRRTRRGRRRGPAMTEHRAMHRREALLVLADGTTFEGEAIGAEPPGGVATGRGRVQHRAVRLPGDHHRPVLRRADHHVHLSAHRQLRRERRPTTRAAGRSAAAWSSAIWPAAAATGAATATSTASCAATASPASPASTPAASPATSATPGAMPGAFGTADEADAQGGRGRPSPAPTASTSSPRSPRRAPTRVGTGAAPRRRLRLRHQDDDPAPPRRASPPSRSCPASTPAADVLAREPDGVFLSNGPGDPAAVAVRGRRHPRPARRGAGVRHLPRPPAARPRARRRHLQAAVRPPRRQPPGAPPRPPAQSRSPARTTTSPSTPTRSPARRGHPRQPQRRRRRGHPRAADVAGVQRAVPPRGGPRARTTPRYLFEPSSHDLHATGDATVDAAAADDIAVDPAHRVRARSSSARRASSTTRARRPAGCCARRATGSSSPTRTRRRS